MRISKGTIELLTRFCTPEVFGATGLSAATHKEKVSMVDIGKLHRDGYLEVKFCSVIGSGLGGEFIVSTTNSGRALIECANA